MFDADSVYLSISPGSVYSSTVTGRFHPDQLDMIVYVNNYFLMNHLFIYADNTYSDHFNVRFYILTTVTKWLARY